MNSLDFMDMALDTAYDRIGTTSPNPAVGALIVRAGKPLACGGTCAYGCDHAEVMAINSALETCGGSGLSGCEIYVTLEPCSHWGKTPPCADAIIRNGIRKVYIPLLDPNPVVAGNGVRRLREAGIEVEIMRERSERAADLLRPFKRYILDKKPFILSKSAVTLDGRIATSSGDSKWISSPESRYLVHRLRSRVDAVMVGKNTLKRDNPSLNVRLDDFDEKTSGFFSRGDIPLLGRYNSFINGLLNRHHETLRQPLRVAVGLPGDFDMSAGFFADENYLVIETGENIRKILDSRPDSGEHLERMNIFQMDNAGAIEQVDIIKNELYRRGIMFVLLEGGGRLAGSFFDAGAIDQFLYFIAPSVAGAGFSPVQARGHELMADSMRLRDISCAAIGEDLLYCGYAEACEYETM